MEYSDAHEIATLEKLVDTNCKRNKTVTCRLDMDEYKELLKFAAANGYSKSEALRALVRLGVESRGLSPTE